LRSRNASYPFGGSRVPSTRFQCPSHARRFAHSVVRLTCPRHASTTNCWSSLIFLVACRRVRLKGLLSLCGPQRSCPFALMALDVAGNQKRRAEVGGRLAAVQAHEPRLDDEAAQFDEAPRALTPLDLPRAHVMPRPCDLMSVARRPVAPERRPCRGQLPVQIV